MIVDRSLASRLLEEYGALGEKAVAVALKPFRVCQDCLDEARQFNPELRAQPLTRRDIEVLMWKCNGRGCFSPAQYMVDADAFTAARKQNRVLEKKDE